MKTKQIRFCIWCGEDPDKDGKTKIHLKDINIFRALQKEYPEIKENTFVCEHLSGNTHVIYEKIIP